MKRGVIVGLVALFFAPLLPADTAEADPVYPIVFPVAGDHHYSDTWGAARSGGRTHEGTDIMAAKMTPIVAAADGVVGWMHNEQGGRCCAMELRHDDGYRSWYIHMNNDTPGTDDGQGWGFAPGIEPGARVRAGQLIGWVGDSGNAESVSPHLHFELHDQSNIPFNPYESLLAATPPDGSVVTWSAGSIAGESLTPLQQTVDLHVHNEEGWALTGDFDGDAQDEVAVKGVGASWEVAELDGASSTWLDGGHGDVEMALSGDFDGDGDTDAALFHPTLRWTGLRAEGDHFVAEDWGRFGGYGWQDFIVADFDGDGRDEFIAFHPGTKRWWVTDLVGTGFYSVPFTTYGSTSGWQKHLAADVDGDGSAELLSFHPWNGTWWASSKGGTPWLVYDVSTNSGWQYLSAIDVDGDGGAELVMFHPSNGTWWVVDGAGEEEVYLWGTFTTRYGWTDPMAADLDDDGDEELIIRHEASGRVWMLRGGETFGLRYLGELVAGAVEAEWLVDVDPGQFGLLALKRG